MIVGIGVDMVKLSRLPLERIHFIERVLTPGEQALFYSKKTEQAKREFLGGRFAAKEAYAKAKHLGLAKIGLQNIEILNYASGEPYLNDPHAHLSITHEKDYAIAFVVLEKGDIDE